MKGSRTGLPGTYLNGFYEVRPLPYAEAGYGFPEEGQTVVNVTNGKIIRLLVEDEPLDLRYGQLRHHERVLDLRAGVLRRTVEWVSPTGRLVRVTSTRLVSFTHRAVAAIYYEVEALEDELPVVVQSELVSNEPLPAYGGDPRAAAALASPLRSEMFDDDREHRAFLVHSTNASGLRVAAAMDHMIDAPDGLETATESYPDLARMRVIADIAPGRPLRLVKFLAYGWSARAIDCRGPRPGGSGAVRRSACGLGWAAHAAGPTTWTTSGTAPMSSSTEMPSSSRRCGSACSTSCRRAHGESSARSPPRG